MQVLQPIIHLVFSFLFSFSFFLFFLFFFFFNRFSFSFVHTVLPSHTSTVTNQTLYRNQHLGHKRCWNVAVWGYIYIFPTECQWSRSYDVIGEQRWTPESVTEADLTTYQENKSEYQRRTKVELLPFTVHVSVSLSLCRPCSFWSVCLSAADYAVTVGANSSLRSVCLRCSWLCRSKKTWARPGHYCITVSRHCTYFLSFLSDMLTSMQ